MATREELDDLIQRIQESTIELYVNTDELFDVDWFAGVRLVRSPLVPLGEVWIFDPKKVYS